MISLELRLVVDGRERSPDSLLKSVIDEIVRRVTDDLSCRAFPELPSLPPEPAKVTDVGAVTVQETAQALRLSVSGVRKLIARKQLKAIHVGTRVLIPMQTLREVLDHGLPRKRRSS
jgi:excisionase family DNA binding protein